MKILFLITYSLEKFTTSRSNALAQPMLLVGLETSIVTTYRELNFLNISTEEIIQEVKEFQPNLIIYDCHEGPFIELAVIKEIQSREIPILIPLWDSYFTPWINHVEDQWLSAATILFVVDSITNYYKYRALITCYSNLKSVVFYGGNHVNTEIFSYNSMEKKYDICLIGSKIGIRANLINYLEEVFADGNISFYRGGGFYKGSGFDNYEDLVGKECAFDQTLTYEEYSIALNQSRICLNAETFGQYHQIKGRVFEYLACGAFCLTNYASEVERFFPADCLVMYKDFDDCVEKIYYYLEHEEERQIIAQRGYEWFHQSFNYKQFWEDFLKAVVKKDYRQINLIGESGLPSKYRIG